MRNLVILGAGTGGALVANMLSGELDFSEWTITVIEKATEHHYQPGYVFIPFKLYGYQGREDVARKITDPLPPHIIFKNIAATRIDHQHKKVETEQGSVDYDWLVCAMGSHVVPDEIEGLPRAMGNSVHTFYTLEGALECQRALERMESGRLVIATADIPLKCPSAVLEFAFLADYYFHKKGIRERVEIIYVTPFAGAFIQPNASRVLSKLAANKNIHVISKFTLTSVDAVAGKIRSFEGDTVDYDLLGVVPPNRGPAVIENSGLGDGLGYGLADPKTLKSRKADCIYFIGDNSNVTGFKSGSVAHFQAQTVVQNLLREMKGEKPLPSYDGHANCFIETGYEKAILIDFNYDMEPLEGTFPLPLIGPFSLLKESYINHVGKVVFKWVYWNMLLSGCMPMVPLVPSQMDFIGKDLTTAPHLQHARALRVGDVMRRDVVKAVQGTSLLEAAKRLTDHNVSGMPVVSVDNKLIGVLSEADFLAAMHVKGDSSVKQMFDVIIRRKRAKKKMGSVVEDIMTPHPITVREDDTLQHAIEVMSLNKIKRLIITDAESHVRGIISRPDLVKLFLMKS